MKTHLATEIYGYIWLVPDISRFVPKLAFIIVVAALLTSSFAAGMFRRGSARREKQLDIPTQMIHAIYRHDGPLLCLGEDEGALNHRLGIQRQALGAKRAIGAI